MRSRFFTRVPRAVSRAAFIAALCAALCAPILTVSCEGIFPRSDPAYAVELPSLPRAWTETLGEPRWRVEWFDGEGRKRSAELPGKSRLEISLPGTMATAVLALPFWPEKGIAPGVFRPAGAIFPFDVSGKRLTLSWRGGVDAAFFAELARAAREAEAANGGRPPSGSAALRLPWNFDWPRFRALFDENAQGAPINAQVRADPWLADWRGIADRTTQSGFDRRRLVPEARSTLELPLGPGPWVGASPFAAPLVFEAAPEFPVKASADAWASAEGLLRASAEAWMWREFD